MRKTRTFLLIVITCLSIENIFSQEASCIRYPFQFTFLKPIGTSGVRSDRYTYHFSFNVLTGSSCGIRGFELGGLLNTNKTIMTGCQVAGIGNRTGGNVSGLQIGGVYSFSDSLIGAQINGVLSTSGNVNGLQVSGVANINRGGVNGLQLAGVANINEGDVKGVQIGGVYNKAKVLKGVQIGLINVVDTVEKGLAIGLINIIKKGHYREWVLSAADYQNVGVSYKSGTKMFYTIYTIGANFLEDDLWTYGVGFGHIHEMNSTFSFQPELVYYKYFPDDFKGRIRDTHTAHFKFGFLANLSDQLALSFVPSIYGSIKSNHGRYDRYGYEETSLDPILDSDVENSNSHLSAGVGLSVGIVFK